MAKKKKAEAPPASIPVQIIRLSPGFSTKFKEDLGWWFKTDPKKAAKILDVIFMSRPLTLMLKIGCSRK